MCCILSILARNIHNSDIISGYTTCASNFGGVRQAQALPTNPERGETTPRWIRALCERNCGRGTIILTISKLLNILPSQGRYGWHSD